MTFTGTVAPRIMSPRGWATGFAGTLHQYVRFSLVSERLGHCYGS
jgi:hypothetical protein